MMVQDINLGATSSVHFFTAKVSNVIKYVKENYNDLLNDNIFNSIEGINDEVFSEKVDYIIKPSGKLGFTNERINKLLSGGYYGSTNPNYA